MDLQKSILRTCAFVVLGALSLRLLGGPVGEKLSAFFAMPKVTAAILSYGSGRFPATGDYTPTEETETAILPTTTEPTKEAYAQAVFSVSDQSLVSIRSSCSYSVQTDALLTKPLVWNLSGEQPTVLIVHTHGTESYTKTEDYSESSQYRTLDCGYNTVSIGSYLASLLEKNGIHVIHDQTLHDYPSYNNSYNNARQTINRHLSENPSIQLVLDLHRDAMTDGNGQQICYTLNTDKGESAKLMLVIGSDAGGLNHPNWQENMALAVKLHAQLEKSNPGICRPISFRSQRFNQDLSRGAVLIEVGSAGNTRQQALVAAEHLAQAIISLASGSTTA